MSYLARIKKKLYFVAAWYFRIFANLALRRWHPRIIAITGSAGKTTMLHLCEAEFGERGHYSHFANSAFGVAFDLVGIRGITGSKWRWLYLIFAVPIRSLYYRHQGEFYFVEIDGERPHEAEFLAKWLQPEVTLWVSLGRSHAVQFEKVVAACPVPIVIAGGKKLPESEALELAYKAVQSGARGVDMGRNIFQAENPAAMIQAVRAVVHKFAKPSEAFELYKDLCAD